MPYAEDFAGIYLIRNNISGNGYVGQSARMRKRIADHFNLLRRKVHPNQHLQHAFSKYGELEFSYDFEVLCEDDADRDALEEAYLSGEVVFDATPVYYNISKTAHIPMRGRHHTQETKEKISRTKKGRTEHVTERYRNALAAAHQKRVFSDPKFVAKIKFIVDNEDMSYAERGRILGTDTGSVRKHALRYKQLKGTL
jgi:group I intron endonuclease